MSLFFLSHLTSIYLQIWAHQFSLDIEGIIRNCGHRSSGMPYSSAEKFISISQRDPASSAESVK